VENAPDVLCSELLEIPKGSRILLCPLCDPYQPAELEYQITRKCLEVLKDAEMVTKVLTKSDNVLRDEDLFSEFEGTLWVGVTLTSLSKNKYESYAPPASKRIKALKRLKSKGIKTFISIEPWIPFLTNPSAIIAATQDFIDFYIIGKLNYTWVPNHYYIEYFPGVEDALKRSGKGYLVKKELSKALSEPDYGRYKRWLNL